jgi:hypothetical protein
MVEEDQLVKEQKSVIRTNCMDCLDRTNVVQSALARIVITKQLVDCGIFNETDRVDMFPDFERMFRNSTLFLSSLILESGRIMQMAWVKHTLAPALSKRISRGLANVLALVYSKTVKIQSKDILRTIFSMSQDKFRFHSTWLNDRMHTTSS